MIYIIYWMDGRVKRKEGVGGKCNWLGCQIVRLGCEFPPWRPSQGGEGSFGSLIDWCFAAAVKCGSLCFSAKGN